MLNVQDTGIYVEFPKTLHADFYNPSGMVESKLDALYAKYRRNESIVYIRDSVKVVNLLKGIPCIATNFIGTVAGSVMNSTPTNRSVSAPAHRSSTAWGWKPARISGNGILSAPLERSSSRHLNSRANPLQQASARLPVPEKGHFLCPETYQPDSRLPLFCRSIGTNMEYRRLGRSGLQVSVLSFGSWVSFSKQINDKLAEDLMSMAYDNGINFLITPKCTRWGK